MASFPQVESSSRDSWIHETVAGFQSFQQSFYLCLALSASHGIIATAVLDLAWMPVVMSDFPASALLMGLAWRFGYPLFWFGVFGTLWWYLLSIFFFWLWQY